MLKVMVFLFFPTFSFCFFELVCISQPLHQLSKPGELRQEYEAEISKVSLET